MSVRRAVVGLAAVMQLTACHRPVAHLNVPFQSAVALSGVAPSMIYVARTRDGVLAIDLGWSRDRSSPIRS